MSMLTGTESDFILYDQPLLSLLSWKRCMRYAQVRTHVLSRAPRASRYSNHMKGPSAYSTWKGRKGCESEKRLSKVKEETRGARERERERETEEGRGRGRGRERNDAIQGSLDVRWSNPAAQASWFEYPVQGHSTNHVPTLHPML